MTNKAIQSPNSVLDYEGLLEENKSSSSSLVQMSTPESLILNENEEEKDLSNPETSESVTVQEIGCDASVQELKADSSKPEIINDNIIIQLVKEESAFQETKASLAICEPDIQEIQKDSTILEITEDYPSLETEKSICEINSSLQEGNAVADLHKPKNFAVEETENDSLPTTHDFVVVDEDLTTREKENVAESIAFAETQNCSTKSDTTVECERKILISPDKLKLTLSENLSEPTRRESVQADGRKRKTCKVPYEINVPEKELTEHPQRPFETSNTSHSRRSIEFPDNQNVAISEKRSTEYPQQAFMTSNNSCSRIISMSEKEAACCSQTSFQTIDDWYLRNIKVTFKNEYAMVSEKKTEHPQRALTSLSSNIVRDPVEQNIAVSKKPREQSRKQSRPDKDNLKENDCSKPKVWKKKTVSKPADIENVPRLKAATMEADANNYFEEEKDDITDPKWSEMKELKTEAERFSFIKSIWNNSKIHRPNRSLTAQRYRSRRILETSAAMVKEPMKRKASDTTFLSSQAKRRKTYPSTYLVDIKIKSLRDKQNAAVFNNKDAAINNDYNEMLRILENAKNEIFTCDKFYEGIGDDDDGSTKLDETQVENLVRTDKVLSAYKKFYRQHSGGSPFF